LLSGGTGAGDVGLKRAALRIEAVNKRRDPYVEAALVGPEQALIECDGAGVALLAREDICVLRGILQVLDAGIARDRPPTGARASGSRRAEAGGAASKIGPGASGNLEAIGAGACPASGGKAER